MVYTYHVRVSIRIYALTVVTKYKFFKSIGAKASDEGKQDNDQGRFHLRTYLSSLTLGLRNVMYLTDSLTLYMMCFVFSCKREGIVSTRLDFIVCSVSLPVKGGIVMGIVMNVFM